LLDDPQDEIVSSGADSSDNGSAVDEPINSSRSSSSSSPLVSDEDDLDYVEPSDLRKKKNRIRKKRKIKQSSVELNEISDQESGGGRETLLCRNAENEQKKKGRSRQDFSGFDYSLEKLRSHSECHKVFLEYESESGSKDLHDSLEVMFSLKHSPLYRLPYFKITT
jgi:hypothetical protein